MKCLDKLYTPQIKKIHSGKVRESFRLDEKTRLIVVSDRVSSFDSVLNNLIPNKGAVLNAITNYWFNKTRNIVDNHLIKAVDPNISLVKEAQPIKVEMIVRGYLTGSMWRGYKKGKREFSGVQAVDGLSQNQKFPTPLLTPTTKEEHDREITPEDIVKEGWTTKEIYDKMAELSMKLFELGTKELAEKGIILVDTKYEFGIVDGEIILIDEIHTPDSSRFWDKAAYEKDPAKVDSMDKEYIRQWLLNNKIDGKVPDMLPEDVIETSSQKYIDIYERILGEKFIPCKLPLNTRIYNRLLGAGLIKDGYVIIIMGSPADLEHCKKIKSHLEKYDIYVDMRVTSAHKNGERLPEITEMYNNSVEPGCVIAVAGRSNGLGGALAANLAIPLINCPPFKDKIDMMVNINSSLVMPSKTPASTVIDVSSAALAALRSLNLQRLKEVFREEIAEVKLGLVEADEEIKKN
ncbi:MAG: phosphoribosylaminoimidazolesuccinocarboxamide synthase [Candidatus Cloacimonetes bacterium]|nr:phosphoribosylaminoimidazolesuccinocarboxamide synthase [Candidatus Cloacimonadota bacterium]MCF7812876.1 phosphoribosylaminoimidazolesuccinocarboxamide synthase [Candidatus Cloacimonadota bacterium]MCF7867088.1 phosphoribosylaminoimidazolesuccinocarboxamide synthase [Candidatus Cloacimonadota bacterium]MCF7882592.1 phosphoribosylaminoimidazolesuccinocarboxamide synthase [Candidatus Cloacimonadota bacterium]